MFRLEINFMIGEIEESAIADFDKLSELDGAVEATSLRYMITDYTIKDLKKDCIIADFNHPMYSKEYLELMDKEVI